MWVTILEKSEGGEWSAAEIAALEKNGVRCETFARKPRRLVALTKPFAGLTFREILGHANLLIGNHQNFIVREVAINMRWEDMPIPICSTK
jgi:hypothetical protein